MTRFLSLRTSSVGGGVAQPQAFDCDGTLPLGYAKRDDAVIAHDVAGCDVILAIHGFNVSQKNGIWAMIPLEGALALRPTQRFFGVLWPGDFVIPVINYPWEANQAVESGTRLAAYCNVVLKSAASLSFISHSLGARVLLETVQRLARPAAELCIAAGAVDRDCLEKQYAGARTNAARIAILSSTRDMVLKLAYPAGDWISDILLRDNDSPWRSALGLAGPDPVSVPEQPAAIPRTDNYGHGDYLPSGSPANPPPPNAKWPRSANFMRRAVNGEPVRWL